MSTTHESGRERHLTDGELFTLAVPPVGEPEALPRHLSECLACSRALSEWKSAARELGQEEAGPLSRRSAHEWEALEEQTLAAIGRSRVRRYRLSLKWMTAIAAMLLLFAVGLPLARSSKTPKRALPTQTAELSAQDQADDALLRDIARLTSAREETGGDWNSLVPEPDGTPDNGKERL